MPFPPFRASPPMTRPHLHKLLLSHGGLRTKPSMSELECTEKLLINRGPNAYSRVKVRCVSGWQGFLAGSTLWTQGSTVVIQPLSSENGSLLLWNGDMYPKDDGPSHSSDANDTEEVFANLLEHGVQFLEKISGPYSFIFLNAEEKVLWFGRDVLGRHSLLWSIAKGFIELSSVGIPQRENHEVQEVPPYALYKIDISTCTLSMMVYPWYHLPLSDFINVEIPFTVEERFQHYILNHKFGYAWQEQDPTDSQIIQYPGNLTKEIACTVFQEALKNSSFLNIIYKLRILLFNSVEKRVITQPGFCKNCLPNSYCCHPKIGILFSGGLDSALLAQIAHTFVDEKEPIDLYNVCFQRTSNHKFQDVPDRINGLNTLKELQELCPKRKWNFIEININKYELAREREEHISKLIYPLESILDDSLGCALWFAARGRGLLDEVKYESPSRIVLLGLGADELFGGYVKHRQAYANGSWNDLGRELCESLTRIGERNLGRDNRVVADHGRQPRTPYLDEELVAFVDSLPPWQRCFLPPNLPAGVGDKFILRLLAWELGLRQAAVLPKKALQFGSHIANPKEKGHLKSGRLPKLKQT